MTKPKSTLASPQDLRANPWNTNRMSPGNEAKLDESMRQFGGLFKPILVRETPAGLEIIGGQHRWESAMRLGLEEVPIFNLGPITDEMAKKIGIADNARYGSDDTLALADLLKELGDAEDLQKYLPYSDADLTAIFSSSNIALDDLDIEIDPEDASEAPEEKVAKAPKTHTVMRFKVPLADAERITTLITETQKDHGFTTSDELTNAGDALVHLLISDGDSD